MCYAIRADGTPVFARELEAGAYSTPLILGDMAYVASLDKNLYAIGLENGEKRWNYVAGGRIFASPVVIEASIYVGANDGCLHEIDPKTGEGHPVFQTAERIVNRIAYNTKTERLFVPTIANELYCMRRP